MAKTQTPGDTAAAIEAQLLTTTGRTSEQWSALLRERGITDERAARSVLKEEFAVGHFRAQVIARAFSGQSMAAEYADADAMWAVCFSGTKARHRPVVERWVALVQGFGDDVRITPCKTYVSAARARQFVKFTPMARGVRAEVAGASGAPPFVADVDAAALPQELESAMRAAYAAAR